MTTTISIAPDKRVHLVLAAAQLLHEQGFQRTTLADVAGRAQIPLGNLYYYFRTKEALAEAVISAHETALQERFAAWANGNADPRKRLRLLIRAPLDSADRIIQFGCPHGSLCQELEKLGPDAPLARAGTRLLKVYLDWANQQFVACGYERRRARALATELVAGMQGAMLVASTMRSHDLLAQLLARVETWLNDTFRAPKTGARR